MTRAKETVNDNWLWCVLHFYTYCTLVGSDAGILPLLYDSTCRLSKLAYMTHGIRHIHASQLHNVHWRITTSVQVPGLTIITPSLSTYMHVWHTHTHGARVIFVRGHAEILSQNFISRSAYTLISRLYQSAHIPSAHTTNVSSIKRIDRSVCLFRDKYDCCVCHVHRISRLFAFDETRIEFLPLFTPPYISASSHLWFIWILYNVQYRRACRCPALASASSFD